MRDYRELLYTATHTNLRGKVNLLGTDGCAETANTVWRHDCSVIEGSVKFYRAHSEGDTVSNSRNNNNFLRTGNIDTDCIGEVSFVAFREDKLTVSLEETAKDGCSPDVIDMVHCLKGRRVQALVRGDKNANAIVCITQFKAFTDDSSEAEDMLFSLKTVLNKAFYICPAIYITKIPPKTKDCHDVIYKYQAEWLVYDSGFMKTDRKGIYLFNISMDDIADKNKLRKTVNDYYSERLEDQLPSK